MDREKYKLYGKSFDIIEDNIKKLQELFPEIVTEGKVDIDKLALLFDKARNEDTEGKLDGEERYEFTWKGKKEAMRLAQKQSTGTLRPCREDSVNFDETQNLYIEGDNLEVLRALQSSYRGKVKMIYIDPPYNTGNDFVYKDDFKDNIANYKEKMNEAYKTNTNNDGRYHTNWLNMMYPRLKLARNLLTDDGVIFISIDDNEVANLKKICDEILGEENYVGDFIRKTKSSTNDANLNFNIQHENILIYIKSNNFIFKGEEKDLSRYKNLDNDPNGEWVSSDPSAKSGGDGTYFGIKNPYTGIEDFPPKGRYWAFNKKSFDEFVRIGRIKFKEKYKECERGFIYKTYKNNLKNKTKPVDSLKFVDNIYMNQAATKELNELGIDFEYPKGSNFIEGLINIVDGDDFIILDFFSGSSTTAQAVINTNLKFGGKRKFIMVQLPEEDICEKARKRIKISARKILEENKDKEGIEDLDIGFKVFKLDSTNLKAWDENLQSDKDMVEQLEDLQNPIKDGRTTEDLVYEIMLKYGVDLTMPIEELEILGSKVYSVGCGYLMICLEDNISLDLIEAIGNEKPNRVVLADKGLTTSDLINGEKILTELGVQDIRTI
ncbi:site-specific DNA-methyltransferase [Clostridium perfringens]|uniref:site-specific DNA-methyltransferase n=1 Tax=Clostridium perfringens TaxID=1502 RepID=UPI0018E473AB|nr:site-specific DNA-methyltransferase [Clostridium perfringens]MBI5994930.1 site-specific DNA-methyltransferase [Clostridium perfringens]MBI6105185.1 site-specific DNA-methyltransferase [Clostridium perfringens]